MSITVGQIKTHLTGMLHGGTLNKVRNVFEAMERGANVTLTKIDPIDTERVQQLTQVVHDDLQNYPIASDYKKTIDIAPVEDRQSRDRAQRVYLEPFAAGLSLRNKVITIESNEGTKFMRINWKSESAQTLHTMDSLTADGTISVVGSATGLKANTLYKLSGSASIEFDLVASGDGIQDLNKTNVLDLEDWDEYADFIVPVYFGSVAKFTSITFIFGNDLTTKYWTSVAQTTQADGTAVKAGWNFFIFPWSTATETGTVNPVTIDSFKLTIAATGAISNIRVDNILVSLGRVFEHKYYSQYIFKNSAGTWISKPTTDDDTCILTGTALEIYMRETVAAMAQQMEGKDSEFDLRWTASELAVLYPRYRKEYPSQSKPIVGSYTSTPRFKR